MSVTEFADHDRTVADPAGRCDRADERLRIGLADTERVLAADEGELVGDAERLHQEFRRALHLIGADGLAPAGARKGAERRLYAGVELRLIRDVGVVVGQKIAKQSLELERLKLPSRRREASGKQRAPARAQHRTGVFDRQRRQAFVDQDGVQRPHQVAGRVGERAVEIIDDGRRGHRRLNPRSPARRR